MAYLLCLDNEGCELSLTVRKVYQSITDKVAEEQDFVRLTDDTDEDYVFPMENFVQVSLPVKAQTVFRTQKAYT